MLEDKLHDDEVPPSMTAQQSFALRDVVRGHGVAPGTVRLAAGFRCVYWDRPGLLTDEDKERLYALTSTMASAAFQSDVSGYWREKARSRYFDRVSFVGLVVDPHDDIVGWTGYHRIRVAGHTCMYIDSTGVLPRLQHSGLMGQLFGRLVFRELRRNLMRTLTVGMRTENPVVYNAFRRALGKDNLFPQAGKPVTGQVRQIGLEISRWLGQESKLEPDSLILRGAYDNFDVMYGEQSPAAGDDEVTQFFHTTLRRQDALIIIGKVRPFSVLKTLAKAAIVRRGMPRNGRRS
jgi:hypothetical protein